MIKIKYFFLKDFTKEKKSKILKKKLIEIVNSKNEIINSLKPDYDYSFSKKLINRTYKNFFFINVIGMGGSILGTKAIFGFLKNKIKKKVKFTDNLVPNYKKINNKNLNIIVSKSGNTLETIINSNIYTCKNNKNIFITENTENYLRKFAMKLKAEVVDHNNFIGGRYSVLSEVGMLPAFLFGLNIDKFKKFNELIKNKLFFNNLINNVANIFYYIKKKKFNSVIINYDEDSDDLFKWYQQLVAESLGKKGMGIFPIVSSMPKDNHSLLQLYLDGPKNNFFTIFYAHEKKNKNNAIKNYFNLEKYIKNKSISNILEAKKIATENVFLKNKLPFRSINIYNKNEEVLGELFTFFILETILLGKIMKINPFDQPAVELIKKETKIILQHN